MRLSTIMNDNREQIQRLFAELTAMSENNLDTLEIYAAYLVDVENNLKDASEIYDRLVYCMKNFRGKKATTNLEVDSMSIVIISGMYAERGRIR